jgi:hypothetical protein
MEMEKSFYVITAKPSYIDLMRSSSESTESDSAAQSTRRFIATITQGGFGQDVIDDERQTKERFLEYLFFAADVDLPRTPEVFDQYFELEQADELVDLDDTGA